MVRWGGLRLEPYKPDAVDADHDGVVQEDTAFERPAGTRLLNSLGQAIVSGMTSADALDGLRFVDADGNDVAYTPRWVGKIDAGPDTAGLTDIRDSGAKIVGEFSASLKDRGLMIGDAIKNRREIEKKRAAAKPGTFGNPVMARDVDHAIELINQGHFVELEKPQDIVTLTERLVELNDEAIKKGVDMPSYGLCYASVKGTNLFCAEQFKNSNLGFIRAEMPQVGGKPRDGSKAHMKALEIEKATGKLPEEVTAGDEWMESLAGRLIGHEETTRVASHMHASQNELVAKKVANFTKAGLLRNEAIRRAQAGDPMLDPRETDFVDGVKVDNPHFGKPITLEMAEAMWHPGKDPIYVSRDGYVIDGHHRWAAVVNVDAADGTLGQDSMPVVVIDLSIHEALADARAFTADFGILAKSAKVNDLAPADTPDTPDVPDVNPLQGTIVDDVVHAHGSQREKREVLDPVMEVFDRVLIAPIKRSPDDQVHVDTEAASLASSASKGSFNRSVPDRRPNKPTIKSKRFNENLRKDAREDGLVNRLPDRMSHDTQRASTVIQTGLSHRRARAATPDEIEAQRAANRAGPSTPDTDHGLSILQRSSPAILMGHFGDERSPSNPPLAADAVYVAWPQGGAWYNIDGVAADVPYVVEPWDGTIADAMDAAPSHDWDSWEAKGYSSEREYLEAAMEFIAAGIEHDTQARNGWPDLKNRKKIKVARTGKRRGVIETHDPLDRQLTFAHELFHHFDYGYDPRGVSHMLSEIEEIITTDGAVPPWLLGDDADPIPGRAEAMALIDAALNSGSMREYRISNTEGGVLDARLSDKLLGYVESPREIFARAATQWFIGTHGSEEQREAARGLARKSVGEVMRNAQEAIDEAYRLGIEFDTEEERLDYLHDKAGWDGTFSFTEAEMEIIGPLVEAVLRSWNAIK